MEDTIVTSILPQIELEEHKLLDDNQIETVKSCGVTLVETPYECAPVYLGLLPNMQASYFVGASWLDDDHSVVVTPKMKNLDYMKMWGSALKFNLTSSYLSKFYGIDLDAPQISVKSDCDLITPLLILQFLSSIKNLIHNKFKRGYLTKQENLFCKVKGRILVGKQMRTNLASNKPLNTWCEFQEFSKDIVENRVLKRALLFCERFILQSGSLSGSSMLSSVRTDLNQSLRAFDDVSSDVSLSQLRSVKSNKLFRHYDEPLRLAKMILKRFGNTMNMDADMAYKVPPYWIDMSRLYEVFIYEKLYSAFGSSVKFQIEGYGQSALDFIKVDEQLIIDTKYKPAYDNESDKSAIVHDVRQLSGYARDEKILKAFNVPNIDNLSDLDCVVIYPFPDTKDCIREYFDGQKSLLEQATKIKGFRKFWKIGVELPMKG